MSASQHPTVHAPNDLPSRLPPSPATVRRTTFNAFFPRDAIEPNPVFANYQPTTQYTFPPALPLQADDPDFLEEMLQALKTERDAVASTIATAKLNSSGAASESQLASYEISLEWKLVKSLVSRIRAAAGDNFTTYVRRKVRKGDGLPSEESELEPLQPDDQQNGGEEEFELFGDAQDIYEANKVELPEDETVLTDPITSPKDALSPNTQPATSPEINASPAGPPTDEDRGEATSPSQEPLPALAVHNIVDSDDVLPAPNTDEVDEEPEEQSSPTPSFSRKRERYAEEDEEEEEDELQISSEAGHDDIDIQSPFKRMRLVSEVPTSDDKAPLPIGSDSANGDETLSSGLPSFTTMMDPAILARGFEAPSDDESPQSGSKPSLYNSYYRDNGDMYTQAYRDRVGDVPLAAPAKSRARPALAPRVIEPKASEVVDESPVKGRDTALFPTGASDLWDMTQTLAQYKDEEPDVSPARS